MPRTGPVPQKLPVRPNIRPPPSPKAASRKALIEVDPPEEASASSLRAPLVRAAAAKKKAQARRASVVGSDEILQVADVKSRRASRVSLVDPDPNDLQQIPDDAPISYFDIVLRRAEKLLKEVAACAKPSSLSDNQVETSPTTLSYSATLTPENAVEIDAAVKKYTADSIFKENFSNIDWLVRGVPEVFDSECEIDDALVDRLLKEGGPPPAELLFPSIHETSQKVMSKLGLIRRMNLSIRQLIIHNARSGVRKDCSYLTCTPPLGAGALAGTPLSSQLMLTELRTYTMYKRGQRVGLLDDYFSGKEELGKIVSWPLRLTDKAIRSWITGCDAGCLVIELYSYLSSPKVRKLQKVDPLRIGYVKIPLGSLLTSDTLDAVVTAEVISDPASAAAVTNRLLAMPGGAQLKSAKPLGQSMGLLTLRVTLSNDENEDFEDEADVRGLESKYKKLMGFVDPPFKMPNYFRSDNSESVAPESWKHDQPTPSEQQFEEARMFIPKEIQMSASKNVSKTVSLSHISFVIVDVCVSQVIFSEKIMECADAKSDHGNLKLNICYKALNSEGSMYVN